MAINIKPQNRGKLHRALGVPQGKSIPMKQIRKAEASKSPALRKEAQFADNARGFRHSGKPEKQGTTAVATDRGRFGIRD